MSKIGLNKLKARNGIDRKALGRGIGSGCGKTSSYGHKGGKARSGRGAVSWFEGGQMPVYRRLPKRGFRSLADKSRVACVNLLDLQKLCDLKILKSGQDVDIQILKDSGVVRSNATTLRLLGAGKISVALNLSVNHASGTAKSAVEALGGKVIIV